MNISANGHRDNISIKLRDIINERCGKNLTTEQVSQKFKALSILDKFKALILLGIYIMVKRFS